MNIAKFSKEVSYMPVSLKDSRGNSVLQLVTSDRKLIDPEDMDVELSDSFNYFRFTDDRWPKESIEAYLSTKKEPHLLNVVDKVRALVMELLDIEERFSLFIALWIVGTYFFLRFDSFPYISANGERDSGKTTLMETIGGLVPYQLLTLNATPAGIFHVSENLPATLLLDETESFDREILSLINSGYKKGGFVLRAGGKTYNTYSPKVMGAINTVPAATRSRCVEIQMLRAKRSNLPLVSSRHADMAKIRGKLFRFALISSHKVESIYQKIQMPVFAKNRAAEIVRPLASIAEYIDNKYGSTLKDELYDFFEHYFSKIEKVSDEVFYTINLISEELGDEPFVKINPALLAKKLSMRIGGDVTPTAAGSLLTRLGFTKKRTAKKRYYFVTRDSIEELKIRYQLPSQVSHNDTCDTQKGGVRV